MFLSREIDIKQFLEIETSDIIVMGHDLELMGLAFSLYPLSFFLYSPFKGIEILPETLIF